MQGHSHSSEADGFVQRMYPFCCLVFGSSDFHITGREAANMSRRAVRSQLKELVSDMSLEERFQVPSVTAAAKAKKVLSLCSHQAGLYDPDSSTLLGNMRM